MFFKKTGFDPDDDPILAIEQLLDKKAFRGMPKEPPLIESSSDLNTRIFGEPSHNLVVNPRGDIIEAAVEALRKEGYLGNYVVTSRFFMLPGHILGLEIRTAYFDIVDAEKAARFLSEVEGGPNSDIRKRFVEAAGIVGLTHVPASNAYRRMSSRAHGPSDFFLPGLEGLGVQSGHIHYEGGGIHYIRRNGNYKTLA